MNYYHQIFCRFRICKWKVPPPSLLSNDFEKSCFFKIFSNYFFSKLTFLNSRWYFWKKNDDENMSRCNQIWNWSTTKKVRFNRVLILLLRTSITFFVVLQFQIWLQLDMFSTSFLFQKCQLEFQNVNFEKKSLLKILKKNKLFSKSLLRSNGGGAFRLHFWNLQKIWW